MDQYRKNELNELIATRLYGWKKLYTKDLPVLAGMVELDWLWDKRGFGERAELQTVPDYASDIKLAMDVADTITRRYPASNGLQLHLHLEGCYKQWQAAFNGAFNESFFGKTKLSASEAIVDAALVVMESMKPVYD